MDHRHSLVQQRDVKQTLSRRPIISIEGEIRMDPNSNPIDNFPRIEPEDLRERGNALKVWNTRYTGPAGFKTDWETWNETA